MKNSTIALFTLSLGFLVLGLYDMSILVKPLIEVKIPEIIPEVKIPEINSPV